MPARNKNSSKLLTSVYRGIVDLIPPEFRAKFGIKVEKFPGVNLDNTDVTVPANPIVAAQVEQDRNDERAKTTTSLLSPLSTTLVETFKNEDGQIATRTRKLVSEGTPITADSTTVEGQQKNLGNGLLLQDKSEIPTVFNANNFDAQRRTFLPLEWSSSVDEIENATTVAGTASAQTTSGATIHSQEQQQNVFTKRVSTRTLADFKTLVIKEATTDPEMGIPILITKQIVDVDTETPGVQGDGSYVDLVPLNKDYQIKVKSSIGLDQTALDALAQTFDTTIDYHWPDKLIDLVGVLGVGSETTTPSGTFVSRVTYGNGYSFNGQVGVKLQHGPYAQSPVTIVRTFHLVAPTIAPSDIFYWILNSGSVFIQGISNTFSVSLEESDLGPGSIVSRAVSDHYSAVGIPPVLSNGITLGTSGFTTIFDASSPTTYPGSAQVIRKMVQRWRLGLYIMDTVSLKPAPF